MLRAVARTTSFDGAFEDMPLTVQRAAGVDRTFYRDALCRDDEHAVPRLAWVVEDPKKKYTIGSHIYRGAVLQRLALEVCAHCPVQWDCAAAALEADEQAGIWADTLDNLRALRYRPGVIEMARSTGVSIQETVRMLNAGISC